MHLDNYGIPCTLQKDGVTYSSDVDKAEVLNRHFASVFTKDSGLAVPSLNPSSYYVPSEITIDEMNALLGEIDPFKTTGPNCFPPKLLKELAYVLSPIASLILLFNVSLQEGCLPCDWKTTSVTPYLKKIIAIRVTILDFSM